MRRVGMALATVGLGMVLGLYGCGGSGSADTSEETEAAPEEQVAEEAEETEEEEAEPEQATSELGKAELTVAGCNYRYKLKEVGSFAGDKNSVSFQYDGAIGFTDDGKPQLLGTDGAPLLDGAIIRGIEYWANGYYLVALDTDDINNVGLVSLTDGVIVPPEAATLSYATENPEDARFIEVVYATEETDNEDECFVYSTDSMFSLSVEEGDTMYKGYAKVFDLEAGAFVDGVEITNGSRNAMKDFGDAFVVEGDDETYTMYDPSGKEIWHTDYYPDFGAHSLAFSSDGKYRIIDGTGKETFVTDGWLNSITSTSDLYRLSLDDSEYIIDSVGNVVLEGSYESVISESHGIFCVKTDEDTTAIVDATGAVLTDDVEEYTVSEIIPGVVTYKNGAGARCLCLSDGRIIENVDGSMSDFDFYQDDNHLVLKTGSYDVTLASTTVLDKALIRGHVDSSSSLYALYDLFSGKELLDASYETIGWAGGYVFAYKDGTWTVYQVQLKQK